MFSCFTTANTVLKRLREKILPAGIPSFSKWKYIFKVLSRKEKKWLGFFLLLILASSGFLGGDFYLNHTTIVPSRGGEYIEGVIGQPRFINPIYGVLSDVDRDLTQLLFSGLMSYDENGNIVPDLAKDKPVNDGNGGKVFEVYLKENLFWSDGEKLTADDVIFTIKTIQDPDYKSPLRAQWLGVEVEKISDLGIRFTLKNPYSAFLENLTLKILPHHIWQNITPQNFPLSPYNLSPVSLGPYQLKKINQDKAGSIRSLTLVINPRYHRKNPNIKEITFLFFTTEDDLIKAALKKEVQGLSVSTPKDYESIKKLGFRDYQLSMPRYFAVFFNPAKSIILSDIQVRKALNYGTNKEEIIKTVLWNEGKIVNSPILSEIYGFSPLAKPYEFNLETAKKILEDDGFKNSEKEIREKVVKEATTFEIKNNLKLGSQGAEVKALQSCLANPLAGGPDIYPEGKITGFFGPETKDAVIKFQEKYAKEILEPQGLKEGTGLVAKSTITKLNELCAKSPAQILQLSFSLTTVDQTLLVETTKMLKNQWQALGVSVEIKTIKTTDSQTLEREIIKPRNYEAILFGEALGTIPDPFPFWHSSQKKDPGLNLAMYEDKNADKLLEESRESMDSKIRKEKLEEFQNILNESSPAVFLYSPTYIYLASNELKGVDIKTITDPSKRFLGVENWYLKTERKWR